MRLKKFAFGAQLTLATSIGFVSFVALAAPHAIAPIVQSVMQVQIAAACKIKGNISQNTGEHIYHVPGQRYYSKTRIMPEYGERWFCSEAEARAAGWRKSKI